MFGWVFVVNVQRADIFPSVKWLTVAFEWFEKYGEFVQIMPERIEGSVSSLECWGEGLLESRILNLGSDLGLAAFILWPWPS